MKFQILLFLILVCLAHGQLDESDPWGELGLEEKSSQKKEKARDSFDEADFDSSDMDQDRPKSRSSQREGRIKKSVISDIESNGERSVQKRTAIKELYLVSPRIEKSSRQSFWRKRESLFRQKVATQIQQKSHFPAVPIDSISGAPTTSEDGYAGLVTFHIKGKAIKVELLSADKKSPLMKWVFPQPARMTRKTFASLSRKVANSIISAFPYRGYVTAKRGEVLRINRGERQGFTKGMVVNLFEFDSTTPNFNTPKWTIAQAEIHQVSEDHSFAKILSQKSEVSSYTKVDLRTSAVRTSELKNRVHDSIFASVGWSIRSIEINPDILDQTTRRLQYKSAFSPFLTVAGGYSRYRVSWSSRTTASAFEQVQFQFLDGSAEILHWVKRHSTQMLIAGVISESYNTQPIVVDNDTLASVSKVAPYLGFHYQQVPAAGTKLSAEARGYFPVNVSSEVGSAQGFAFGFGVGLTIEINRRFSLAGKIDGRLGRYSTTNGRGVPESVWSTGVFLQGHL